jgi:hypothetical protein
VTIAREAVSLPEAIDVGGDGDEWWIAGHVSEAEAFAAFRRAVPDLDDEVADHELCVTRGWWKDAQDPLDDERWISCDETARGAVAFTRIEM